MPSMAVPAGRQARIPSWASSHRMHQGLLSSFYRTFGFLKDSVDLLCSYALACADSTGLSNLPPGLSACALPSARRIVSVGTLPLLPTPQAAPFPSAAVLASLRWPRPQARSASPCGGPGTDFVDSGTAVGGATPFPLNTTVSSCVTMAD